MIKDIKNNLIKLRADLQDGNDDSEIYKAISGEVEKLMRETIYAPSFPPFWLPLENVRKPAIATFSDADDNLGDAHIIVQKLQNLT